MRLTRQAAPFVRNRRPAACFSTQIRLVFGRDARESIENCNNKGGYKVSDTSPQFTVNQSKPIMATQRWR